MRKLREQEIIFIMQITNKFTIAVHVIAATKFFENKVKITSFFLAGSIGGNPALIRSVMRGLKAAGIIHTQPLSEGIRIAKPLDAVTFYDVYKAVDCVGEKGIFHFHENPNPKCPVGKNIHAALDDKLKIIQTAMEESMKKITIADVMNELANEI